MGGLLDVSDELGYIGMGDTRIFSQKNLTASIQIISLMGLWKNHNTGLDIQKSVFKSCQGTWMIYIYITKIQYLTLKQRLAPKITFHIHIKIKESINIS